MALMVYIKEVHPRSFLLFTTSGEGFCLRDFSKPGLGPAVELARQSNGRTASTIRKLASKPGNHLIEVTGKGKGVEEYAFWHEETLKLNALYAGAAPPAPATPFEAAKSWLIENILKVVVAVITAVAVAAVLAWLGLKQ